MIISFIQCLPLAPPYISVLSVYAFDNVQLAHHTFLRAFKYFGDVSRSQRSGEDRFGCCWQGNVDVVLTKEDVFNAAFGDAIVACKANHLPSKRNSIQIYSNSEQSTYSIFMIAEVRTNLDRCVDLDSLDVTEYTQRLRVTCVIGLAWTSLRSREKVGSTYCIVEVFCLCGSTVLYFSVGELIMAVQVTKLHGGFSLVVEILFYFASMSRTHGCDVRHSPPLSTPLALSILLPLDFPVVYSVSVLISFLPKGPNLSYTANVFGSFSIVCV